MWYFRYGGHSLKGSRFGKIAQFQEALSFELTTRGQVGAEPDGVYGKKTRDAIVRLCEVADFIEHKVPESDARFGAITFGLWDRLLPTLSAPTVHERAFVISLSHEGTDYDRAEWNFGTSDQKSVLTWGPYGATVGHGKEVQAVLHRVSETDNQLLNQAFGAEFAVVQQLLDDEDGETLLEPVDQDVVRRKSWLDAFQTLGGKSMVRNEYDAYAFTTNQWLRPPIRRLYTLIPDAAETATPVDYGFFLDLAMHMGISEKRVTAAQDAIATKELELGRRLTSAERRRVISGTMIPSAQQKDRLGRNVVFFVDDVGEEGLTADERSAWEQRTGRRASDCGLTDEAPFFPEFLN